MVPITSSYPDGNPEIRNRKVWKVIFCVEFVARSLVVVVEMIICSFYTAQRTILRWLIWEGEWYLVAWSTWNPLHFLMPQVNVLPPVEVADRIFRRKKRVSAKKWIRRLTWSYIKIPITKFYQRPDVVEFCITSQTTYRKVPVFHP